MYILIISDPYIERSLIDYFTHMNNRSFILLRANHPEIQTCVKNNIYFMDLNEALEYCDCVYILNTENIPDSLIAKCRLATDIKGIPFLCSGMFDIKKDIKEHFNDIETSKAIGLPVILILQAGIMTQIEKTELNLCTLLQSNNVRYLLHTNSWLPEISKMANLLNVAAPYKDDDLPQIAVVTIKENVLDFLRDSTDSAYFDDFVRTIRPDYIIMCCENDCDFQNQVDKIFSIKYSRSIDTFILSEYVSLQSSNKNAICLFIENTKNINLFDDIKIKLTFPLGVKEIL